MILTAHAAATLPGEASSSGDTLLFYGALTFLVLVMVGFFLWLHALNRRK